MIARIRGPVVWHEQGTVIVETSGVGFKIRVPDSAMPFISEGKEIILYTELIIRQDLMQLYGFLTPEEVEMFRLLISVSHVGPHTGLAIMSRFSVSDICDAILSKRSDVLSQVQGLGKKGADRIILELQKKVAEFKTNASISEPTASPIQDSVLALIALGYTREEATQAIEKISSLHGTVSSPEMVKEALVYLRKK